MNRGKKWERKMAGKIKMLDVRGNVMLLTQ